MNKLLIIVLLNFSFIFCMEQQGGAASESAADFAENRKVKIISTFGEYDGQIGILQRKAVIDSNSKDRILLAATKFPHDIDEPGSPETKKSRIKARAQAIEKGIVFWIVKVGKEMRQVPENFLILID